MDPTDLARLAAAKGDAGTAPSTILKATNSVGITIILWIVGGIVVIAGLLVWLKLGLSIPRFVAGRNERSDLRSGGDKNYVGAN